MKIISLFFVLCCLIQNVFAEGPKVRMYAAEGEYPGKVFSTQEAEKGDLLVSIRAPIGPCNIAPEKCAIGRGIAAIKANNKSQSGNEEKENEGDKFFHGWRLTKALKY